MINTTITRASGQVTNKNAEKIRKVYDLITQRLFVLIDGRICRVIIIYLHLFTYYLCKMGGV